MLSSLNQAWLSPDNLENFANATFQAGSALQNCFGFGDGMVRPVPPKLDLAVYFLVCTFKVQTNTFLAITHHCVDQSTPLAF